MRKKRAKIDPLIAGRADNIEHLAQRLEGIAENMWAMLGDVPVVVALGEITSALKANADALRRAK
jgi:hypothetical protein